MGRRETYPCASLNGVIKTVEMVYEKNNTIKDLMESGVKKDDIRLTEILGLIKSTTSSTKYYTITKNGEYLLSYNIDKQKTLMFSLLIQENNTLPSYFKQLINNKSLHDKKINTNQLNQILNINDLWSAEILNEWCRSLNISEGSAKTEVYILSEKVKEYKIRSFKLKLYEVYSTYVGSSRLVPVAKMRKELKNSGVMGPSDDFDTLLAELAEESNKIEFFPAPSRFVGLGLEGKQGYELISIDSELI